MVDFSCRSWPDEFTLGFRTFRIFSLTSRQPRWTEVSVNTFFFPPASPSGVSSTCCSFLPGSCKKYFFKGCSSCVRQMSTFLVVVCFVLNMRVRQLASCFRLYIQCMFPFLSGCCMSSCLPDTSAVTCQLKLQMFVEVSLFCWCFLCQVPLCGTRPTELECWQRLNVSIFPTDDSKISTKKKQMTRKMAEKLLKIFAHAFFVCVFDFPLLLTTKMGVQLHFPRMSNFLFAANGFSSPFGPVRHRFLR